MPGERQLVLLKDFRGGINKKFSKFDLRDYEAQDALNVFSSEDGNLCKRGGLRVLNSGDKGEGFGESGFGEGGFGAGYIPDPINGLHRAYMTGTTKLIVSAGTVWYTLEGDELTSRATGKTAGQKLRGVDYLGHAFLCNGKDQCQRTNDGVNYYRWGFDKPGNPVDGGDAGAGDLGEGTYQWKLTYYKSTATDPMSAESSPSASIAVAIGAGGKARTITLPGASLDDGVNKIRIYRTTVNGTAFYLEAELAHDTASYKSENEDDKLGTAQICPVDGENDPPPVLSSVLLNGDRVYALGDPNHTSRYYWSKIGYPESFSADNWIDIDPTPGDVLVGQAVLGQYNVVFKRKSVYVLVPVGDTPYWDRVQIPVGCISADSVVSTADGVIWLGADSRVYRMDLSLGVEVISPPIEPLLDTYSTSELKAAAACYWNGKYMLALHDASEGEYRTYMWDTRVSFPRWEGGIAHPWWPWSFDAAVFEVLRGEGDSDELYFGSRSIAKLYQYTHVTNGDDGEDIECLWQSKPFDLRPAGLLKAFRSFSVRSFLSQNVLKISFSVDEGQLVHFEHIVQEVRRTTWDNAVWDVDKWDAHTEVQEHENRGSLPQALIGRTICIKIQSDDALSVWKVLSCGILYRPKTVQSTFRMIEV